MKEFKKLWMNRNNLQGRINITVFFANIFLLLCHLFLMVVYVCIGHKFMIGVNIVSILIYSYFIKRCYKNIERCMGIVFLEIWIHLICGVISFGWTPCYQNWCFGMIVAYFLPAFSEENKETKQRPLIYAFIIVFTYLLLAVFYSPLNSNPTIQLNKYINSILFVANNVFAFIIITLFALFYTSNKNRKEIELNRKAEYDELTGLFNRHALSKLGDIVINKTKEKEKTFSVAILDIDHFKEVNDTYGHTSGDLVLKKVADTIRTSSVDGIIPGRWGGEEFIMIAPDYIEYSDFINILEKLRIRISKTKFEIENKQKIDLTISIGASIVNECENIEDAIALADVNLYKAKETGRNKVVK